MAITIKQILATQINNSVSSYTNLTAAVGSTKAQIIKNMRFFNTGSGSATLTLAFHDGTGANQRVIGNVIIPAGALYIDDKEITLQSGHNIQYKTGTTGGPIDVLISGIERDL